MRNLLVYSLFLSQIVLDDHMVQSWARMLAHIALRLDFRSLVWGENIVRQFDIAPKQFPFSPGPKFYEHKDRIIDLANQFIEQPINYASGDLLH